MLQKKHYNIIMMLGKKDYKSGYCDDTNNYHLFTPCGCNPLSFRATSLPTQCGYWQYTYVC